MQVKKTYIIIIGCVCTGKNLYGNRWWCRLSSVLEEKKNPYLFKLQWQVYYKKIFILIKRY